MAEIYKKLAKIQSSVRGLTKNGDAYGYKYVDGNKCIGSIRPLMEEMGLLLMPEVKSIETKEMCYKVWNDKSQRLVDKTEVLCVLKMTMTWVDSESGETLVQEWASTGMNAFDKSFGSALTYGERYYLLKFFHIPTDRDDVDYISTSRDKAIEEAESIPAPVEEEVVTTPAEPEGKYNDPTGKYTPREYRAIVSSAASGRKTKSGGDPFLTWKKNTGADAIQTQLFQNDVARYTLYHPC